LNRKPIKDKIPGLYKFRIKNMKIIFSHILVATVFFGAITFAVVSPLIADTDAPVPLEDLMKTKSAANTSDTDTPLAAPADPETSDKNTTDKTGSTPKKNVGISDDEIRRLRESGEIPVTKPKGIHHKRRTGKITRQFIPTPGSMVIDQIAKISKHPTEDWMVAKFEPASSIYQLADLRILPCQLLESIEKIIAEKPDTRFALTGEVTVCRKKVVVDNKDVVLDLAYLLPTRVTIVKPKDEPENNSNTKNPTTNPADANEDVATTDLIGQMREKDLNKTVLVNTTPSRNITENQESVAPAGRKPFESGKKTLVVDRIVRIMQKDKQGWWEARFKSDNTLREPPMRILPNKTFEKARTMTRTLGTRDLQLRISGMVTHYKGRRYLIIRKVLPERDMNQF
jgi:hypothetical protein